MVGTVGVVPPIGYARALIQRIIIQPIRGVGGAGNRRHVPVCR